MNSFASPFRRRLMLAKIQGIPISPVLVIRPSIVKNVYIGSNGQEIAYSNWSATTYIDCGNYKYLYANNSRYCHFYDENKNPIGNAVTNTSSYMRAIPSNAKYYRYSSSDIMYPEIILSNVQLNYTTLTDIEYANSYIEATNGRIINYNGWNVFRVAKESHKGLWHPFKEQASYASDGSVISAGRYYFQFSEEVSFVRTSRNKTSVNVYLLPEHEYIDMNTE